MRYGAGAHAGDGEEPAQDPRRRVTRAAMIAGQAVRIGRPGAAAFFELTLNLERLGQTSLSSAAHRHTGGHVSVVLRQGAPSRQQCMMRGVWARNRHALGAVPTPAPISG